MKVLRVFTDGASRGNPGPAALGVVIEDDQGMRLRGFHRWLGRATNNEAEYAALIEGLKAVKAWKPERLEVFLDSKLVVEQMSGRWQIKHPDMRPLAAKARETVRALGRVSYTWVPRSRNAHADRLANQAMDAAAGKAGAVGGPH